MHASVIYVVTLLIKFWRRKTVTLYGRKHLACFGSLVFDDDDKWANEFELFRCPLAIAYVCNIELFPTRQHDKPIRRVTRDGLKLC